jgi:hypothetical protein
MNRGDSLGQTSSIANEKTANAIPIKAELMGVNTSIKVPTGSGNLTCSNPH